MRKRVHVTLAMLLLGTLGVVAWSRLHEREPVYQGQPVSFWINRWGDVYAPWNLERPDFDRKPMGWIPDMDARALPFLVRAMNRPDGLLGKSYSKAWLTSNARLRKRLPRPLASGLIRLNAILALGELGPAGEPAVPALHRALNTDRPKREKAAIELALKRIRSELKARYSIRPDHQPNPLG